MIKIFKKKINITQNTLATVMLTPQGCIVVAGVLNFDTVVALRELGNQLMQQQSSVIFDLAKVKQVDSSALTLLLAWYRYAKQQSKSISFINIPQQLFEIAELAGLGGILNIYNTRR